MLICSTVNVSDLVPVLEPIAKYLNSHSFIEKQNGEILPSDFTQKELAHAFNSLNYSRKKQILKGQNIEVCSLTLIHAKYCRKFKTKHSISNSGSSNLILVLPKDKVHPE